MSDKSFGDQTNRNIVTNPLLSTAVTGLSLEDLTHNAVLLPVTHSQELITRRDQQIDPQNVATQPTTGQDANSNPSLPPLTPTNQNVAPPHPKQQKAEDDFDVNEYFARLQGTRYVSAPLNSSIKEESLQREENLEEINLNEPEVAPERLQQSLTADIAQNFSQLPTVLPQVASAVFSSFSNMLSYKSREVTPDERCQEVQGAQIQGAQMQGCGIDVPLIGVDEMVTREVAPPPREPPIGGTTNYRITTKKKAYAQIPGLSSQLPPQNVGQAAQSYHQPPTFAPPTYFTPDSSTNIPQPPIDVKHDSTEVIPRIQPAPVDYNIFNPTETIKQENTQAVTSQESTFYTVPASDAEKKPEPMQTHTFQQVPANSVQGSTGIIPPPPMFSNIPKKDSQTAVGKTVLPPSVARRIGANHPFIKPNTVLNPAYPADNIFIPAPISDTPQDLVGTDAKTDVPMETAKSEPSVAQDPPPVPNLPSAFVQFKSTYSTISSMNNPYNVMQVSDAHPRAYSHRPLPMVPPCAGRLNSPPSASVRLPSPNQMPCAPPPSFFNPGDLSSSLSAVNATRRKSVESLIASNTANLSKISTAPRHTCPGNMPRLGPSPSEATPQSGINTTNLLPETQESNISPSTFYNPNLIQSSSVNTDVIKVDPVAPQQIMTGHYFDQAPTAESTKPVPEPPKLTGGLNYRMTKKRPQYYSGPIEGIGAISNNVKPVIPDLDTRAFQGALFTPGHTPAKQQALPDQFSTPFDISTPAEMTSSYTPFAINSQINNQAQKYVQPDYNTAFDLSRPTTENYDSANYETPREESKGFGIIGSLKSKLSSLDINKIQNSVTTFFDPAYNTKIEQTDNQGSVPHHQSNVGYGYSNQDSNLEIFVPNVEQNRGFNQSFNTQDQYQNVYSSSKGVPQGASDVHYYQGHHFQNSGKPYYPTAFPEVQPPWANNVSQYVPLTQPPTAIKPEFPSEIPSARQAFEEVKSQFAKDTIPKSNQDVALEQMEKTTVHVDKTAPFNGQNYIAYNLFGNTATITPTDIEIDELANSGSLESTSTLSFFDNQQYKASHARKADNLLNPIENLQTSNENVKLIQDNNEIVVTKNIGEPIDLSVEILQPNLLGGIKSCSDLFGASTFESKSIDFVQNPYGCAFIKNENDDEISKELEKVVDETVSLVLNEDTGPIFGVSEVKNAKLIEDLSNKIKNVIVQEETNGSKTRFSSGASVSFLDTLNTTAQPLTDEENEGASELNICETCREIDKPEDDDVDDLTVKLIENITSPIQLSNPVAAALTETNTPVEEKTDFESKQCAEISHITEETIETIQVQSATELLDAEEVPIANTINYGWNTQDQPFISSETLLDPKYEFQVDKNAIGFFGNNPMFFDDIPNNASDEIKAEFKNTQDDVPAVLPRQMSIPSAPPAEEDDTKSDETGGLDVLSIEQDAKKDFPLYEEFVIEPSETDDDKIEYREREKSTDDPIQEADSFTNRVDRFNNMEVTVEKHDNVFDVKEPEFEVTSATSPAITIASYFDTGNYAVEAHYRNSLSSPSSIPYPVSSPEVPMRIPPGFEDEYRRRLSGFVGQDASVIDKDTDIHLPPTIPDTSTQTRPISTTTYSSVATLSSPVTATSILEVKPEDKPTEMKLPEICSIFGRNQEAGDALASSLFNTISDKKEITESLFSSPIVAKTEAQVPLPDPISFFSAGQESTTTENADGGFNRLASYFQTPAKTDHGKSFFELSQSQNHYRHSLDSNANSNQIAQNSLDVKHFFDLNDNNQNVDPIQNIPRDVYVANLQLMKDLTSVQNIAYEKDQIVRTVNYFTVEYDNDEIRPNLRADVKTEIPNKANSNNKDDADDDELVIKVIKKCVYCCSVDTRNVVTLNKVELDSVDFKFKKAMDNDNSESSKDSGGGVLEDKTDDRRREVALTFGPLDEESEGVALATENRTTAEYSPVKHHWFYRVDFEGKSIWRGFSAQDNKALEDAFHSSELTEDTLVATDGGRFDVNVVSRLRIAVYWTDKPTNVRRCSWFYKGATDARYVPYTEPVAEKLEEEYRHGITTGEWHRRLVLPNNESVVMHGPSVMVHFPQSASDAFGSTPLFAFGKRVYRNPPKIRVSCDQSSKVDHLVLLVHGAGEYRNQKEKEKFQSTMRPRVVRRGCDETEIEDPEPSSIDHLLLLCHGVGSACDMRFRSVEEVVDDFRSTSLQLLQSHYRNSYDKGVVNRVEVLPISWHATLHSGETGVDKRLAAITLDSIPKLRNFTNDTVLDVLFYTSPVFCQTIIDTVCAELNRIHRLFTQRNPHFRGQVSLGGHSLGSVILYDLLCHQASPAQVPQGSLDKSFVTGSAGSGQGSVVYPPLEFRPAALYALGSPIAMFECIRGVKSLGADFSLPTCKNFFNIFHPYDPIAYRIEPLINSVLGDVKPSLIPHHKGRKRMHLELKDTMARVGADLKQKLLESLKATWTSMWKTQPPPNDGQLEKVVEEEMEKEQLCDESKEDEANNDLNTQVQVSAGRLNGGRRVDYVLQEAPFEMINEYLFAMSSHVCYWESEDTMLLMLREIYDALGVAPDGSVPQHTLTVQRARPPRTEESETIVMNATEHPSTSRGGT